jgi:molecular chaperone GrpE
MGKQNEDMSEEENLSAEAETEEGMMDASGRDPADDAAEPSSEDRVAALEKELADLKDRSLRALADAENTRRRAEREVADAKRYGASGLVKDLLNVSDNLHRALESVTDAQREQDEAVRNLITGVEMVEKELLAAFEKHGVKKLEPAGEKFDHDFHQAMYEVEDTGHPAGTVVELLQPGYVMHDRLLRPAMVAVAKGGSDSPDDVEHVDTTA